jgi:hypothetical protein
MNVMLSRWHCTMKRYLRSSYVQRQGVVSLNLAALAFNPRGNEIGMDLPGEKVIQCCILDVPIVRDRLQCT